MNTKLPIAVITNCSATRTIKPTIRGIDLPKNLTMQECLEKWLEALDTQKPSMTPAELYRGIGFNTIVKLQEFISTSSINIVSAGQGLMRLDEQIVPYDFTTDPKHKDSIHKIVTKEPFVMTAWWKMINERLRIDTGAPIAQILNDDDIELVLVACNSRFLKLLPDDFLSASPDILQSKLRIITTSKSTSNIPQQLKPLVITYDRSILASTMGNRNDRNHRALYHFVKLLADSPDRIELPAHEHQDLVGTTPTQTLSHNIDEILNRHEAMLEGKSPDAAYMQLIKMYGSFGGIIKFRAAWRAKYSPITSTEVKINQSAAIAALKGIQSQLQHDQASTWEDESKAIEILRQFGELIREHSPEARFNGGDICAWAKSYFEEIEQSIPSAFRSPIKLSHLLANSAKDLGFEPVYSSGGSGGRTYMLNQDTT